MGRGAEAYSPSNSKLGPQMRTLRDRDHLLKLLLQAAERAVAAGETFQKSPRTVFSSKSLLLLSKMNLEV